jgi:hypothetical protein
MVIFTLSMAVTASMAPLRQSDFGRGGRHAPVFLVNRAPTKALDGKTLSGKKLSPPPHSSARSAAWRM